MKERGILFNAPMVRAVLNGKTQTRRAIKDCFEFDYEEGWPMAPDEDGVWRRVRCPYGQPGDRLWVRETWSHTWVGVWTIDDARAVGPGGAIYRADGERPGAGWWPSIHMPREFSRILLQITEIRVQRLQDISEDDAKAEGMQEPSLVPLIGACWSERDAFAKLWTAINPENDWARNAWVWVVTFKRITDKPS